MDRKVILPVTEGEENALAVPEEAKVPAKYSDDEAFAAVSQGSGYLPFLSIVAKSSDLAAEGKAAAGNIVMKAGQTVIDLGGEVNGLVLGWRLRAMSFGDEVISVYDHTDPEFKRIAALADQQGNQGEMYGPEFLVYSPSVQPGGFCLYMLGNKSSRREAPGLKAILEEWKKGEKNVPAFSLKSRLHKGTKFSWFIPVITVYSAPIAPMPAAKDVAEQLESFNNPPKDEREKAKTDTRER